MNSLELGQVISEILESNPFIESECPSGVRSSYNSSFDAPNFNLYEAEVSLLDHLARQISIEFKDGIEQKLAFDLCNFLDERGYFIGNIEELQAINPKYAFILPKLQKLEPCGVFAQNLAECLKIQLSNQNLLDTPMLIILENLNYIAERKFKALAKKANISLEALHTKLKLLQKMTPHPSANFSKPIISNIIPDLIVSVNKNQLSLEFNQDILPNLIINKAYYYAVRKQVNSQAERHYISHNFNQACSLVKAITQRKTTLLKVTKLIIEAQKNFFLINKTALQPLTLEEIATQANLHVSTISRVINEKYIATPSGTYPLKYFFATAVNSTANTVIKQALAEIIKHETTEHIFSDAELSYQLQAKGYHIQRRTVTKYREMLNIPQSHERKKLKHLQFT